MWGIILCLCVVGNIQASSSPVSLSITAQSAKATPCGIVCLTDTDSTHEIAQNIARCCSWDGEYEPRIITLHSKNKSSNGIHVGLLQEWEQAGFLCVLVLSCDFAEHSCTWRLYDTCNQNMIVGKKISYAKCSERAVAYTIAREFFEALTGASPAFCSRIAYCVDIPPKKRGGRIYRHLYTMDFDGTHQKLLVGGHTITLGPRWHPHKDRSLLYYSECMPRNVRLMRLPLGGVPAVYSSAQGINMLPAVSPGGNCIVLCLSYQGSTCLYRCDLTAAPQARKLIPVTRSGLAVSPVFIDNSRIVFCSDDNSLQIPRLASIDIKTGVLTWYAPAVSCASPTVDFRNKRIGYARMTNGILQIWQCDFEGNNHQQLTHTPGSKEECSWSPCGTWIAYMLERAGSSAIAVYHPGTKREHVLTPVGTNASFPSWSPELAPAYLDK